jgi:excinuclease ABC subunit C
MKNKNLLALIKSAPQSSGVYIFKQDDGAVMYIGKARVLRSRLQSYVANYATDWKAMSILDASSALEWHVTENELSALLLEARLIQSYQPPFNVLLKSGHPYIYFMITQEDLPRFIMTRTKTKKGIYFGPFIDRGAARSAFRFLQESFALLVCSRSITGGCLAYHLGRCAGMCKPDFDVVAYKTRLELVRKALQSKPQEMMALIDSQIAQSNQDLLFERSAQLAGYKNALERVYQSLATGFDRPTSIQKLAEKDIWIWCAPASDSPFGYLFLFRETRGILKKERVWCVPLMEVNEAQEMSNYLFSYYREYRPSPQILVSVAMIDSHLLADFTASWHQLSYGVTVNAPARPEHADIMMHARVYAQTEVSRPEKIAQQLKQLLKLPIVPRRIDCFDISHKQGHAIVGACVRFTDSKPDIAGIRNFHIKTVEGQNDYASLQEIVMRRYKTVGDLPDLIVIDGGKGQLSAVQAVIGELLAGTQTTLVSLAKREETLYGMHLPSDGLVMRGALVAQGSLVALRDYAHHRAISFHRQVFGAQYNK